MENNRQTNFKSLCLRSGTGSRLELYLVDEVTDHAVPRAVQKLRSIFTICHLEERLIQISELMTPKRETKSNQ